MCSRRQTRSAHKRRIGRVTSCRPSKTVVELAWDGHTDAGHPFAPLNNPPPSGPLGRWLERIRPRRLGACQRLASAAWGHGVDQPRQGHDPHQSVTPAGLFHTHRRDQQPWSVATPNAACHLRLALIGRLARATPRDAVDHRGLDPLPTPPLARSAGPTLGGKDQGRWAHPRPCRSIPATAAPGGLVAGAAGMRRAWIIAIRSKSLLTEASTPQ
jgi:hypothetical protein